MSGRMKMERWKMRNTRKIFFKENPVLIDEWPRMLVNGYHTGH